MPLPSFIDHHKASSLKNGDTVHLIETELASFFNDIHGLFFAKTSVSSAKLSLFFLAHTRHPNIIQSPIFKQVLIHNHVILLLTSIPLPNQQLPTETPTSLGTHTFTIIIIPVVLIQDFTL
jgi:hypothetical protein